MLQLRKHLIGLSLLACGCLFAARVSASTTYGFVYTAGQNSYSVAPGGSVTVQLYLQEINSDQSPDSLFASQHGLSEAGVGVSYFSGANTTLITSASANTGSVPTGFDDPNSSGIVSSGSSATVLESTLPPPFGTDLTGIGATPQGNGISNLLLGAVTIHASASPGQTTVFTVSPADANNGNTFTNDNNYDLDNSADPFNPPGASSLYTSAASGNFSVVTTGVPEPAPIGLLVLLLPLWRLRSTARQI